MSPRKSASENGPEHVETGMGKRRTDIHLPLMLRGSGRIAFVGFIVAILRLVGAFQDFLNRTFLSCFAFRIEIVRASATPEPGSDLFCPSSMVCSSTPFNHQINVRTSSVMTETVK
jgi:hypothetical protein